MTKINLQLDWLEYLNSIFSKSSTKVTKDTTIMIMNLSEFYGVLNLIKQTSTILLKNFVMTRIFTYTSPDSNNALRTAYSEYEDDMGYIKYSR